MFYGFVEANKALCPGIFLVCSAGLSCFLSRVHQRQHCALKVFPSKNPRVLGQGRGQSTHLWHRLRNNVLKDDF